jgi:hypothetical protein
MEMRTARTILGFTLMFVMFAAAYVSAQGDVKSLAGKWLGYAILTSGSQVTLQVEVKPDGTYTSRWGDTSGKGVIKKQGDKLMAEGSLTSGASTAIAGAGKSDLTLTEKDGKQKIAGFGRDQQGPYSFELTKQ